MDESTGRYAAEWFWWVGKEDEESIRNRTIMFEYKRKPCKIQEDHDNVLCVGWHTTEHSARHPSLYIPRPCTDFRKNKGVCKNGEGCPLAHGIIEIGTHPSRFCTEKCCIENCTRPLCFFYHNESEKRVIPPNIFDKKLLSTDTKREKNLLYDITRAQQSEAGITRAQRDWLRSLVGKKCYSMAEKFLYEFVMQDYFPSSPPWVNTLLEESDDGAIHAPPSTVPAPRPTRDELDYSKMWSWKVHPDPVNMQF